MFIFFPKFSNMQISWGFVLLSCTPSLKPQTLFDWRIETGICNTAPLWIAKHTHTHVHAHTHTHTHTHTHRSVELSFFQGVHVRIDISISIRPMTTKFGETNEAGDRDVIAWSLRSLKTYLHYHSAYGHRTGQDGNLPWWAPTYKNTLPFDYLVLETMWQTKIISPLPQCLWPPNWAGW